MTRAELVAALAGVGAAGIRWQVSVGGVVVPGIRAGHTMDDATCARLAALRPHRDTLSRLAALGRCPGCERHALPPLVVCYWCRRGIAQ